MEIENPHHHHFDLRSRALSERPVDGDAFLHLGDEFRSDHLELVVAHRLLGTVVSRERIVKRPFVSRQSGAISTGLNFLGKFDQFFDDMHRADGAVVIGVEGLLELLAEDLALHEVALRAHLKFVLEQLFEQLGGDILVFEAAHFGEELIAQDAEIRFGQSGGGEDVDHLAFGGDCLADELADGGVHLLGRLLGIRVLLV